MPRLCGPSDLKGNVVANLLGRGYVAILGLVFIPLYVRFLGVEAYGLIGFYGTLGAVFVLLDMGFSTTLNRELARLSALTGNEQEQRNLVRTLETVYWGIAAFIGISVVLLAPLVATYWVNASELSIPAVTGAVRMMGLVMAFQFPFSLYQGALLGLQRQVLLNSVMAGMDTLRNVGVLGVLWWVSPTISAYFAWQLTITALQTLAARWFVWRLLPKTGQEARFRRSSLLNVWRFAAGMSAIALVTVVLTNTDKVILSKMLSLELFGYYVLAATVSSAIYKLTSPVAQAVFPRFSQLVATGATVELSRLYHRGSQVVSVVILPVAVVIARFSHEILMLWTGNPSVADQASALLSLLVIGTALNGLMCLPYSLQLAYGWTRLAFCANLLSVCVLVPLLLLFTRRYGAMGAAAVWVILNAGYVCISFQVMHSRLLKGEQWRWYTQDVGLPLLAALIIVTCSSALFPQGMTAFVTLLYLGATWFLAATAAALTAPHAVALLSQWFLRGKEWQHA